MEYEKNPHTILNLENDPSPCCYSDEAAYAILSVTITDPDVSRWAKALKIRVTDITDLYVKP